MPKFSFNETEGRTVRRRIGARVVNQMRALCWSEFQQRFEHRVCRHCRLCTTFAKYC